MQWLRSSRGAMVEEPLSCNDLVNHYIVGIPTIVVFYKYIFWYGMTGLFTGLFIGVKLQSLISRNYFSFG